MTEGQRPSPETERAAPPSRQSTGWRNWGDHPVIAGITLLASLAGIAGYLRSGPDASSRDEPRSGAEERPVRNCAQVVGRWDWLSTGGVVAIAEGGLIHWYRVATDPLPTINGTWECREGKRPHLTFSWVETKLIDTLVLAEDGERLTGANTQTGFRLSGTRAR